MVRETKYYDILRVAPDASQEDIKRNYKKISLEVHPDRPGGNEEKFKELSQAYETLSDPEKRQMYDEFGSEGPPQPNHNDIFEQMFGGGRGHPFGSPSFMRQKQSRSSVPDIPYPVQVSLLDIYMGKKVHITYKRNDMCMACAGSGSKSGKIYECRTCKGSGIQNVIRQMGPMIQNIQMPCNSCGGRGDRNAIPKQDICDMCSGEKIIEARDVDFEFDIPRGIQNSAKIGVDNAGHIDIRTHERSKLVIIIECQNHPYLTRNGNDLEMKFDLDLVDALYGCIKQFTHINGEDLYFESGQIRHGDIKIVKGKGMPILQQRQFGNLILHMNVIYPSGEFLRKNAAIFTPSPVPDVSHASKVILMDYESQRQHQQQDETGERAQCVHQ